MKHFKAKLEAIRGGGHFVVVPPAVAETVGLRYGARVRGTVDGVAYRSSLMKYSGVFHMGVHKATIAAAGARSGGEVRVAIEIDDQPLPTDTVPRDLQRAIDASPRAKAGWARQSPSHRREHVKHVIEAKRPETRARRIAQTVAALEASATAARGSARSRASKPKAEPFDAKATADRIRRILGRRDVTEKRMMGGLVFMVAGAMCCSVNRSGLLVRVAEGERDRVLARRHVAAMRLGGRTMTGFVRVEPAGFRTDAALAAWVKRGLAAAAAAPPREAKRRKTGSSRARRR